jgi:hypothetical protein
MQLLSWLRKRMTGRPQTRRTSARRPDPCCRPQLELLEGRDLPSFSAPVVYPSYAAQALVAADIDGDGKADLVTLNNGRAINVQLDNGNGTFGPIFHYGGVESGGDTGTALAVSVKAGFAPAILVANNPNDGRAFGENDSISVVAFNSNASFTLWGPYNDFPPQAGVITSLTTAYLIGNGGLDFVAADSTSIYVGYVGGSIAQSYAVPAAAASRGSLQVALGDFNGDGKPDIVAAGCGSATVFLNNGNGTFAAPQTYTVAGSPTAVAVGDFNNDGKLDIVTANANGTVSLLLNNGNGSYGAPQNYAISGSANSVAVGDFNRDGFLDVVTTGAEMDLLQNNGNGTFGAYQKVGPAGSNVVAGDFVSPGYSDLAQIDASGNNIDVLLNNADPMPAPAHVPPSFGSITYSHKTKLYSETVTLTNDGGTTLTGPSSLELTNLPSGVVLTDATGTTSGNPYIRFLSSGETLKPGASVTITLTFTAPSLSDILFGTEVVAL